MYDTLQFWVCLNSLCCDVSTLTLECRGGMCVWGVCVYGGVQFWVCLNSLCRDVITLTLECMWGGCVCMWGGSWCVWENPMGKFRTQHCGAWDQYKVKCVWGCNVQGRIQVWAESAPAPLLTAKLCKFSQFWGYISYSAPLYKDSAPSFYKSWIRPWTCNISRLPQ